MSKENRIILILHVKNLITREVTPLVSGNSRFLISRQVLFTIYCFSKTLGTNLVSNTKCKKDENSIKFLLSDLLMTARFVVGK